MTTETTIHFANASDKTSELSKMGRELAADTELAQYIAHLRKAIGRTYLNGSLYVKLHQELPRDPGHTVLRNWRRITEKVELLAKSLEGKTVDISNLRSYGILSDRFVLYLPNCEGQRSNFYVTIAQFSRDISADQQEFLKRLVIRTTRPPTDEPPLE